MSWETVREVDVKLSWNGSGRKIYLHGTIIMEWYRAETRMRYRIYFYHTDRYLEIEIPD
jgi:hypothetical protein